MGVRDETLAALNSGITPGDWSRQRGVTLATTLGYLNQMVGEGRLRRSDILFSIPSEIRQAIAESDDGRCPVGVSADDYEVVQQYGDAGHAMGDMYDNMREVETTLHSFIKDKLIERYGESEHGWWRKGVPEQIRKNCQSRREEDNDPAPEAYCYTDVLDLGKVIEYSWFIFQPILPKQYRSNRKEFLDAMKRINSIRRVVMHPVRGGQPSEDDFYFVRTFRLNLALEIADQHSQASASPER